MLERLQKILSNAGIASRRAAEKLIVEGRVTVDGKVITELGSKFDSKKCKICVDDEIISESVEKIYILLNKPKWILSSAKDDRGRKTVIDLINDIDERIYPVGRLDFDTEGLLLLTNDGELTNALLHPKFQINKTYVAKVNGIINQTKLNELRQGVQLEDGITAPAKVDLLNSFKDEHTIQITIHEGRNRQVRRMFAAIGCNVKHLKRIKFANLSIDNLKVGQYRKLSKAEIVTIYELTGLKL